MADKMRKLFKEKGFTFFIETVSNQIFIVLENSKLENLRKSVSFGYWERVDDNHTVVRFATSWATNENDIDKLAEII